MMKGKRTDLGGAACGIARALEVVGDWWSLLLVREAFHGQQRFSGFEKRLGIARNILSKRPKKMIQEDIFPTEPDRHATSRRIIRPENGGDPHVSPNNRNSVGWGQA